MIVKMMITFDYNPETNEYIPLKQEIIKEDKKSSSKKEEKILENGEATLVLYDNKYKLNEAAKELLNVSAGDRISINYQIVNGINFPIIGPDTVWGCNSGNKLTKANTVSCRGQANELLSKFGQEFNLIPYIKKEGLFTLVSNTCEIEVDANITLPDDTVSSDLPEKDNTVEDFDLDDLEIQEDTKIEENDVDLDFEDVPEETYDLQEIEFNF